MFVRPPRSPCSRICPRCKCPARCSAAPGKDCGPWLSCCPAYGWPPPSFHSWQHGPKHKFRKVGTRVNDAENNKKNVSRTLILIFGYTSGSQHCKEAAYQANHGHQLIPSGTALSDFHGCRSHENNTGQSAVQRIARPPQFYTVSSAEANRKKQQTGNLPVHLCRANQHRCAAVRHDGRASHIDLSHGPARPPSTHHHLPHLAASSDDLVVDLLSQNKPRRLDIAQQRHRLRVPAADGQGQCRSLVRPQALGKTATRGKVRLRC